MNLAMWLARAALEFPDNPAVHRGETQVSTYRQLLQRSSTVAARLRDEFGVSPGDRVAVMAANCVEYLEMLYGIWLLGGVAVPINFKLHPREAAWIVDNAEAKATFIDSEHFDETAAAIKEAGSTSVCLPLDAFADSDAYDGVSTQSPWGAKSSDLSWLFYTSGTTGRPKGVMLTNQNLIAMSVGYECEVAPVSRDTTVIYAAPMSHGAGLYAMAHVRNAARHVVPESGKFDPAEVLALCRKFGNCTVFLAPTMVRRLIATMEAEGLTADGLETVVYGGGPMYQADLDHALKVLGPRMVQIFAQGESPMTGTVLTKAQHGDVNGPRYHERLATVGRPHCLSQVRIVDEQLTPVPAGVMGEIELSGPTVMAGYWRNQQATDEAMDGEWLRTGDTGFLSDDGFLTLVDRSKDMIISGGTNIYPREIEEVLLAHPAITEVAVVGQPDAEWGEVVTACIVVENDVDASELDELCLRHIARFKRPKHYVRLDSLPKNNYGKVVKSDLRSLLASECLGAAGIR